jgi:hypothetical protein
MLDFFFVEDLEFIFEAVLILYSNKTFQLLQMYHFRDSLFLLLKKSFVYLEIYYRI